jgi:hypothetical protein
MRASKLLTFLAAILADVGWLLGASRGWVAFLRADTAGSLEDTRVGAFGLAVSVMCKQSKDP